MLPSALKAKLRPAARGSSEPKAAKETEEQEKKTEEQQSEKEKEEEEPKAVTSSAAKLASTRQTAGFSTSAPVLPSPEKNVSPSAFKAKLGGSGFGGFGGFGKHDFLLSLLSSYSALRFIPIIVTKLSRSHSIGVQKSGSGSGFGKPAAGAPKAEAKKSLPNILMEWCKVLTHHYHSHIDRTAQSNVPDDSFLSKESTAGYKGVSVTNFTTSWWDGLAFCALVHRHAPYAIDFDSLSPENKAHNLKLAFDTAEKLGVERFLDWEDMIEYPPEKLR